MEVHQRGRRALHVVGSVVGCAGAEEGFDAGDVADHVGGVVEDGGAAAAGSPVGADIDALVVGIVEGPAGTGVEAIDDAAAEKAADAARVAEAERGVADLGAGGNGERGEVGRGDAEDDGVDALVGGEDGGDGEELVVAADDDGPTFAIFDGGGRGHDVEGGDDGVAGDGVTAGDADMPLITSRTMIDPAGADIGARGAVGDFSSAHGLGAGLGTGAGGGGGERAERFQALVGDDEAVGIEAGHGGAGGCVERGIDNGDGDRSGARVVEQRVECVGREELAVSGEGAGFGDERVFGDDAGRDGLIDFYAVSGRADDLDTGRGGRWCGSRAAVGLAVAGHGDDFRAGGRR